MKNEPTSVPAGDLPARLAQPARRALKAAGITNLEQLSQHSEKEIKELHGVGPNAVSVLSLALAERGLSFAAETSQPGES